MNRCGLMFIFSSSHRLNLIYCLTGFSFVLFNFREIEKKKGCKWGRKRNKGRKQSDCVIVSPTCGELARRSQTVKVERTKKKNRWIGWKGRQRESSDAPHSCCGLLKWRRRNLSHRDGIRNVNRLSQSRTGTVWKERVSTLTEGHARFWDHHWANGKIIGHYVCACVDVCVRVAWGRMWDWLSLLSIMNG